MHSCIKFVGTIYEKHKSDLSGQQIGMAAAMVTTWLQLAYFLFV